MKHGQREPLNIAEYEAFKLANPLLQKRVETPDISKDEAMLRGDFDFAAEQRRVRITQAAYERMRKLALLPPDELLITARDGVMTAAELLKRQEAEVRKLELVVEQRFVVDPSKPDDTALRSGCQCGMCRARRKRDYDAAIAAMQPPRKASGSVPPRKASGSVPLRNRCDCPGCAPFRRKHPSPIGEHPVHAAMRSSGLNTPDPKRVGAAQYRSW